MRSAGCGVLLDSPLAEGNERGDATVDHRSESPQPSATGPRHTPVLVQEVVELLAPRPGTTMVDCTVGAGGHSFAILPHLLPSGRLIAIDRDAHALALSRTRLAEFSPQTSFVQEEFRHLPEILRQLGLSQVQGVLADLGLSSLHVDEAARGFSFLKEGPLDMRMDQRQETTAASLIERLSERELTTLLATYGEERWAGRIARRIVTVRARQPIETTTQLARLVAEAVRFSRSSRRLHPATRTFLALRIAVNDELASLEALLRVLPDALAPQGRAVVISFHSLEDRLVKQAFRQGAQEGQFRLLTKKPIRPSAEELAQNPRARSAKLRAVERL